jgi:hypothetical protein
MAHACENCHKPATLVWPVVGGGEAYTCDQCNPAAWDTDAGSPQPIPVRSPVDPGKVALLGREDAAGYLGLSTDAFDRHVRPNIPERLVGSKPMFRPADLDGYAAGGAHPL